jgi:replication initiation protein RepC
MTAKIMERHALTTSFGRRPATVGQIAAQLQVNRALDPAAQPGSNAPSAVNKWAVFRALTEVRERLGVSDRSLSVLNALLSFHPETALTLPQPRRSELDGDASGEACPFSCDLIVFPSNKALSARAHGMAGMTLWRHLKALTDAGLIIRRDSPNGKRYARKDATGRDRFSHAYGFDLTPLVVRAVEFEAMAEEAKAAQRRRHLMKERISLMRRDVSKLIGLGLDEGLPGDWEALRLRAMALMTPLRRIREDRDLESLETALADLRREIGKLLESQVNVEKPVSNEHRGDRHQSNSNTENHNQLEPTSKEEGGGGGYPQVDAVASTSEASSGTSLPLGMVMEACPDLRDYAAAGRIRTWSEFLAAAAAVRPMIGISPDAWREAQEALGRIEAHVAVAVILQRSMHSSEARTLPGDQQLGKGGGGGRITVNGSPAIRSPGGYLRSLSEKARGGAFALGPILMATIGQRLKARRGSGPRAER